MKELKSTPLYFAQDGFLKSNQTEKKSTGFEFDEITDIRTHSGEYGETLIIEIDGEAAFSIGTIGGTAPAKAAIFLEVQLKHGLSGGVIKARNETIPYGGGKKQVMKETCSIVIFNKDSKDKDGIEAAKASYSEIIKSGVFKTPAARAAYTERVISEYKEYLSLQFEVDEETGELPF